MAMGPRGVRVATQYQLSDMYEWVRFFHPIDKMETLPLEEFTAAIFDAL